MFHPWKAPRLSAVLVIAGLALLGFACSPGGVTGPGTTQSQSHSRVPAQRFPIRYIRSG